MKAFINRLKQRFNAFTAHKKEQLNNALEAPTTYVLQLCLIRLRKRGSDVRLVYDNPQGSLSFQGNIKYVKKIPLPRKRES